ncbi:MAG: hypothetical protein RLZ90_750 [Pseudomonadota bacterium]
MPHMKLIGKLGWLVSIILSFAMGLSDLNYTWLLPITTFQILSYYLFHFKNFKFKKIGKRNNPFIKELPRHLIIQSFITLIFFGIGVYASLLGYLAQFFDTINLARESVKQYMIEFYNAVLKSRFN